MAADPASPTGPHPARARLAQAARCFAAGQLDEAAALCEAVLADIPDDAEACRQLGLVQVVRGAFEAAHALLEPIAPRRRVPNSRSRRRRCPTPRWR